MLTGLRERLKGHGLDLNRLLSAVDISPAILGDDFAWLSLAKFARLLALAARQAGDPTFGLKYGDKGRFASNPLGYILANAPDVRTALQLFSRYQSVLCSCEKVFIEGASSARLEWAYPVTMSDVTHLSDFKLVRIVQRLQVAAGESWRPISVSLMHRAPKSLVDYERLLGQRLSFDQPVNSITLSNATLSLPIPGADPQLFKLITRYCQEEAERLKQAEDPLNRIREAMIVCLQRGALGPHHVASELEIAPHVLHRQLKCQGTSFQRILDDTRRRLAHRYLYESALPLTDIAAKLGYSELSAFSRAVRRWFGASARALRRQVPSLGEAA